MMMHQSSRVAHQSAIPLASVSQAQGRQQHHSRTVTRLPVENGASNPGQDHPAKGSQQQYAKFRSNRSASSSRVVSGLKAQIDVAPKVDCRRKSQVRLGPKGGAGLPEDDSFATDRIPKMELLKVNYVHLKSEEEQSKTKSADNEKKKASSVGGGDRKKASSSTVVVCGGKISGGGKVTGNANNTQPGAPTSCSVQKTDAKQSSNAATSKDGETNDGNQDEVGKSKYLVYKKHNGFGTSAPSAAECGTTGAKLQYINDSDIKIKALAKKKYGMLFENKKKSKLETVQYYFDSRGYERYVDNKLYGVINEKNNQPPDVTPAPAKSGDAQHKRLSWDVRQHNRPSMMRVINQSPAAKKCANVILMNHQTSVKPLSAEAPDVLGGSGGGGGGGGGLKQENCRMFKLQKSHTSTNLLTRHRSMNDIHRINQLFQETRADPDPFPGPPLSSTHGVSPSRESGSRDQSTTNGSGPPPAAPVHRFEKHRKSEQTKYLVHKRLSARYKTECNLPNTMQIPTPPSPEVVLSSGLTGEDTISKRIRQIIDGQDKIGSTETVDQEPVEQQLQDQQLVTQRQKHLQQQRHLHHTSHANSPGSKKLRQLSKSKSAEKLISDGAHATDEHDQTMNGKTLTTCGYKNCKFSNCPMSSASSSSSASSTASMTTCSTTANVAASCVKPNCTHPRMSDQLDSVHCGKRTSIVINDDDDVTMALVECDQVAERKQDKFVINNILNNGKLNEKVSNVNRSKDNGDDLRIIVSSKIKEIDLESNRMIIEKCVASPPPTAGIVGSRQKFWNQQNQRNIKLKNNPQTKPYDDKININNKIKNEENNSIKIFISSNSEGNSCSNFASEPVSLVSTVAASNSNRSSLCSYSSTSSCGSTGSDSDKDDGYCDQSERSVSPEKQQPSSIVSTISNASSSSSTVCSESTNISSVTCTKSLPNSGHSSSLAIAPNRYTSKTSIRLGCDGTLFLNNGYLDEVESFPSSVVIADSGGNDGACGSDGQPASSVCCCRRRQQSVCLVRSVDARSLHNSVPECDKYTASAITCSNAVTAGVVVKSKSGHCTCAKNQKNAHHKIESFSPRPRSIEGPLDSGISISSDTVITSSDSDLNLQSQTDADERKLKRGHVLAELLETERIYVAEMGSILRVSLRQLYTQHYTEIVRVYSSH
uniref:DH domain-containing protein n=1 Tax=Anopheles dirus TaxID=7168 RepID=A0A182NHA6_9DIPT